MHGKLKTEELNRTTKLINYICHIYYMYIYMCVLYIYMLINVCLKKMRPKCIVVL